jgi:hypothetical protein
VPPVLVEMLRAMFRQILRQWVGGSAVPRLRDVQIRDRFDNGTRELRLSFSNDMHVTQEVTWREMADLSTALSHVMNGHRNGLLEAVSRFYDAELENEIIRRRVSDEQRRIRETAHERPAADVQADINRLHAFRVMTERNHGRGFLDEIMCSAPASLDTMAELAFAIETQQDDRPPRHDDMVDASSFSMQRIMQEQLPRSATADEVRVRAEDYYRRTQREFVEALGMFVLGDSDVGTPEARKRGMALFREGLTPEQRASYEKNKWFEVRGGETGKRYRIRHGRQMNIEELNEDGSKACGWCFLPTGALVTGDVMAGQKVALETFEMDALKIANWFAHHGPGGQTLAPPWHRQARSSHRPVPGSESDQIRLTGILRSMSVDVGGSLIELANSRGPVRGHSADVMIIDDPLNAPPPSDEAVRRFYDTDPLRIATGRMLDLMGEPYGIVRYEAEPDSEYRARLLRELR